MTKKLVKTLLVLFCIATFAANTAHAAQSAHENTKKLINDINLQKEMMTNQAKYIDRDTTDKITDVIIRECLK